LIFSEKFVCDLSACRGACCLEGESGAPLEFEEIDLLENELENIKPFMSEEGIRRVEETGVFTVDTDGEYVTPLINGRECAFVVFDDNGIAKCAIEKANRAGKTHFPKPISCHLYPIRLTRLKDFTALNYHRWPICDPARTCGAKLEVKVYRFLKEALIRRFGKEYFHKLEQADQLIEAKNK
jgi:hypothetical protein